MSFYKKKRKMMEWKSTSAALKEFMQIFICEKCHNKAESPIRYSNCGHIFCESCVNTGQSNCFKCNIPVTPKELQPAHLLNNLLPSLNVLSEIINVNPSEDKEETQPLTSVPPTPQKTNVTTPTKRKHKRSTGIPKNIPRNLNKKNSKGETILHEQCAKGNEEYVHYLLEHGADPNTKDHSQLTPLQEVVSYGFTSICEQLLIARARPNTPGADNRTPLHEAAANNRIEEAKLLIRFNANRDALDKIGKKPIDYANSDEMREILSGQVQIEPLQSTSGFTAEHSFSMKTFQPVVYAFNLSRENMTLFHQLAVKHKFKTAQSFTPSVTHVIVETDDMNKVETNYTTLMAILQGKWLINTQWISIGLEVEDLTTLDLSYFEVAAAPVRDIPRKARQNREAQNPPLLDGCTFHFALKSNITYTVSGVDFTKESLTSLVQEGGGKVAIRELDPEKVTKDTVPFHVSKIDSHPLKKCSNYIIYCPGKDEPRIIYRMSHIKALPLSWLIVSIEQFMLLDPNLLELS